MTEKRFVWECDGDTYHILDTVTKARYFYDGIDCLLNEQQATIKRLLEELVNTQQQGYVVGFLHKNERCNLTPKELEDE